MEGSRSEWSLVRALICVLARQNRQLAGYSFRPKTTFSLNFLIEHFRSTQGYRNFRVHVLLFRIHALWYLLYY